MKADDGVEITSKIVPRPASATEADDEHTELWWVFLAAGVLWLVFALLVFQFDETSTNAISILLGVTCVGAAMLELLEIPASHGWLRLGRVGLAVAFGIIGIIAFTDPDRSFNALATIFAFYLLFRGLFEVIAAFLLRGREGFWWLMLMLGLVQILLAFWAAGNFGHKAFLLVVWVGATALAHGVLEIVRAFALRPS
jgi:uncharacterized membrane protein HdeD (DUF308 family)